MLYLLLLAIALFTGLSVWVVRRVGKMPSRTISQHVAKSKLTQIVFGIVGTIASALATIVIFFSILPRNNAGSLMYVLFGLLMLCFFVAAIIPHIKGSWRAMVHNVAAWGMCYLIPFVMLGAAFLPISPTHRLVVVLLLATSCILLALFALRKNLRRQFLAFQSGYLSVFFLFLVVLAS